MDSLPAPTTLSSRAARGVLGRLLQPRFLKFSAIGFSGIAVNLAVFYALLRFAHLHYALASPLAIEASILSNYWGNRAWTWRDRDVGGSRLLHFHGVSLVGMGIQWSTLVMLVAFAGFHTLGAQLVGIAAATAWNFLAHHHFTFASADSPLRRRLARPLLYVASLLIQLVLAALFAHSWDGFVFERSAFLLDTTGETPYATIEHLPAFVYNNAYVPPLPEWYAYPPLPLLLFGAMSLPHALLGLSNEMVVRVLWKLPLVGASVAMAYVARRLARAHGATPRSANLLERFLLFNPFLFVMGALWGMTEPLLLVLLLASLWALHANRVAASGILFGLSALVKIFPIFLYPILLAFLSTGPGGWRRSARHAVAAAATWILVSLPFAALHPRGFVQLVFLMHVQRPPAGYSVFLPLRGLAQAIGGPAAADHIGPVFTGAGLALYLALLAGICLHVRHQRVPERRILLLLGLSFAVFLLCNKVVHSQYLLLLVGLLAVPAYALTELGPRLRRFVVAFSLTGATATLVDGLRLFQFLPADVSTRVLGMPATQYIVDLRQSMGWRSEVLTGVTGGLAVALIVLPALGLAPLLRDHVAAARQGLGRFVGRLSLPSAPQPHRRSIGAAVALLLLLLPPASVGLLVQSEPEPLVPPAPLGPHVLGAYYYVWWQNPTHDYNANSGNWAHATGTPLLGYYSSYSGEIERAVREMQAAGIDFALVPFHGYDHHQLDMLAYRAERTGFRFAPLFDLSTLAHPESRTVSNPPQRVALTESSIGAARYYVSQFSHRSAESPNLLQLVPGQATVFLQGLRWVGDPQDAGEQTFVAELLIKKQSTTMIDLAVGNSTWRRAPQLLTPIHQPTAAAPALLARLWADARADAYAQFWSALLESLDSRVPGARLVLDPNDAEASGFPAGRVGDTFTSWDGARPGGDAAPASDGFATLYPAYDARHARTGDPVVAGFGPGGLTYAQQWAAHLGDERLLIHSWNEHQEGTGIEPTWEWGDRFVDATARWSTHWRAGDA